FRAKVEQTHHVRYWSGADDLAGKVSRTFVQLVRTNPATGWVRADAAASRETLAELNDLRKELDGARRRLGEATTALAAIQRDRFTLHLGKSDHIGHSDIPVEVTWPELFRLIAPTLLQPAHRHTIARELSAALLATVPPEAVRRHGT